MKLEIEAEFWREGDQYVGRANPLDVMSCGNSREAAESALREAVELFLEAANDTGTLEDILVECGYSPAEGAWMLTTKPERQALHVEIP